VSDLGGRYDGYICLVAHTTAQTRLDSWGDAQGKFGPGEVLHGKYRVCM
jgi:hypothetical protein